ncbi:cytochrome P450 3A21-like [Olea europaea subsp. europaea]|uniref:Cytochrome P450 3A21-like n=1 Tax=Olea europaea subsp. europaea TaxID=158383 RepID=A0A8S0RCR3_OLEEU|nr:cytochrome P450 3A21-like [Olea europaea subsp. europaea]
MIVFYDFLLTLAGGLLVTGIVLVASKIVANRLTLLRWKRLSKGLPIFPEKSLLGNHISTMGLGFENCRKIAEAHENLGPYIGGMLGNNFCMSTIDLDLVKRVVIDEANLHLDRQHLNLPVNEFEESIMLVPGHEWKPLRRVYAPALKSNKFKTPNVIHEIEDSITKLIGHIERRLIKAESDTVKENTKFKVDDFVHRYSLDLVFSCFYKQYQLIDFDSEKCMWTSSIDLMLDQIPVNPMVKFSMIFPWFSSVVDWVVYHFHPLGFSRRKVVEFVKLQTKLGIEARRQPKGDESSTLLKDGTKYRRNMVDHIIDAFLEGKLTQKEYLNTTCFLMAAADKTASDCIVHTIYLLSIHQDIQERLRESIKVEGADSEYLAWVLNESLRLLPPAPIGCSRTNSYPIELDNGQVVPTGTFVVTCAYAIHRLKKYWGEDANDFKPERWRDTSHHHPMQYIPFGAGSRACPGREFALFQMKMLFAALLTRYKFEGTEREDAYTFTSPALIYVVPNSPTFVTIKRL